MSEAEVCGCGLGTVLFIAHWPGSPPRKCCFACTEKAQAIAAHLGFDLPLQATLDGAYHLNEMFRALQAQIRLERAAKDEL